MTHSLTLGSLLLTDDLPEADHGYTLSVLAEGASFGVAQGVTEVVRSLLADGDKLRRTRYGNREVTFRVQVSGPSLGAVAEGEAALRRELGKENTLVWQAPDILSVPTVFEVVDSEMAQSFDDLEELRRSRTFTVTLTCAPFARSLNPSITTALPAGITPSSSVIDTCNSATGWTQQSSSAPALVDAGAGAVYTPIHIIFGGFPAPVLVLRRSGAVDFSARRYLRVEWLSSGSPLIAVRYDGGPSAGVRPVISRPQSGGWLEATFDLEGVTSSRLEFVATYASGRSGNFYIRHVESTNVPPAITPRQTRRAIPVGGTERTPGSLAIRSNIPPSEVLGMTIVHTAPDEGSAFPLRSWRVAGNTQTAAANMSGFTEPLTSDGTVFDARVWGSHITPGNYLLACRMTASAAGTFRITWTTSTLDESTGQTYASHGNVAVFAYPTINTYQWIPLAIVPMPTVRVTDGHSVRLTLAGHASNPSTPAFDDAWAFRGGDGCALTVVDGVEDYLWLNSADLNNGTPTILAGNNADGSGARYPVGKVRAVGTHEFNPDTTYAFVATESQYPLVDFEHYHRWHSNAADEGGEVD